MVVAAAAQGLAFGAIKRLSWLAGPGAVLVQRRAHIFVSTLNHPVGGSGGAGVVFLRVFNEVGTVVFVEHAHGIGCGGRSCASTQRLKTQPVNGGAVSQRLPSQTELFVGEQHIVVKYRL